MTVDFTNLTSDQQHVLNSARATAQVAHERMCDECDLAGELEDEVKRMNAVVDAADAIGHWMSSALDDPKVCDDFKSDARALLKALFDLRGCMDGTEVPE